MRIVSWNVAGLKACIKKGCLDFIRKENADIYCFQEVKSEEAPFIEGYQTFNFPAKKKGYSGTLIYRKSQGLKPHSLLRFSIPRTRHLGEQRENPAPQCGDKLRAASSSYSKHKPISVSYGMGINDFDDEGRVLALEFENFFLVNVYFPHSNRDLSRLNFKLNFNKTFEEFCGNLEKIKPLVIAGDFNVAHKETDLANPKQNMKNAGFTIEERNWFDSFLKNNYIDAFREFNSEAGNYTWWPYRNNCRQRNIGWRIDYFVASEKLKSKIRNCEILKDVLGSDHCPVALQLAF